MKGDPGQQGMPGTSVTSMTLDAGSSDCPFGGTAFNAASGRTFACNGAPGPQGDAGAAALPHLIVSMVGSGAIPIAGTTFTSVTIPTAGTYLVLSKFSFSTNTSGGAGCSVLVAGSTVGTVQGFPTPSQPVWLTDFEVVSANAGDMATVVCSASGTVNATKIQLVLIPAN
jgi:hypothetical protein